MIFLFAMTIGIGNLVSGYIDDTEPADDSNLQIIRFSPDDLWSYYWFTDHVDRDIFGGQPSSTLDTPNNSLWVETPLWYFQSADNIHT